MKRVFFIGFFIIIFTIVHSLAGSAFGVRLVSAGCIGFLVSPKTMNKFFPKDRIDFKIIFVHFQYLVDKDSLNLNRLFCIGQDVRY